MGYQGGPQNGVFDTQNMLAQLKCKIDDLQQIVNKISPGSVLITNPSSSSSTEITLGIRATQITWSDPSTGNILTIQQALQSINTQLSGLGSGSGSGSGSWPGSSSSITLPLSATQVTYNVNNINIILQTYIESIDYQLNSMNNILNGITSGSGSGSVSGNNNNITLQLPATQVTFTS
jgi:hypothetical protein